jgi:hypothetical protein
MTITHWKVNNKRYNKNQYSIIKHNSLIPRYVAKVMPRKSSIGPYRVWGTHVHFDYYIPACNFLIWLFYVYQLPKMCVCTSNHIRSYGAFVRHHFCSIPWNKAVVLNYTVLILAVSFVVYFSMSYRHGLVFDYLYLFLCDF